MPSFDMRIALFLLLFMSIVRHAVGQDYDVHVTGVVTDAVTGLGITGEVEASDQLDNGYSAWEEVSDLGEYTLDLYSGYLVSGGNFLVEFRAKGYQPRMFVLDLSAVDKGRDINLAWRIHVDIALIPLNGQDPVLAPLLGYCGWHAAARTLRWNEERTRKLYPIERFHDARIRKHINLVDSVYHLSGTMFDGVVTNNWSDEPLEGTLIVVQTRDGTTREQRTDKFGYYALSLANDSVHDLEFSFPGMVSKRLVVDLTGIPEAELIKGFRTNVNIGLFEDIPGEDFSFLDAPMGYLRYSAEVENLEWDMEMVRSVRERLNAILGRYSGPPKRKR